MYTTGYIYTFQVFLLERHPTKDYQLLLNEIMLPSGIGFKSFNQKRYFSYAKNKRWVVERTNSWHNRFRKFFTRYEKKVENYLGLVQLSCSIIIYRKIILG